MTRRRMRSARALSVAVALGLFASACATHPDLVGGAPFDVPPPEPDQAGIRYITVLTAPGVFLRYTERTDADRRVGEIDDRRTTSLASEVRDESRLGAAGKPLVAANSPPPGFRDSTR